MSLKVVMTIVAVLVLGFAVYGLVQAARHMAPHKEFSREPVSAVV